MPATVALKEFVGQEYRWAVFEHGGQGGYVTGKPSSYTGKSYLGTGLTISPPAQTAHPSARVHEVSTLLVNQADARALSNSLGALLGEAKRLYRLTVYKMQHRIKIGDTITIEHPQYWPAGKAVLVMSVREKAGDGMRETGLTVFG